jgi:NADPH:quinone reductase-like Zn-dependent oxidoreductase
MEGHYALSTFEWLRQTYDGRMDYSAVTTGTVQELLGRPPMHLAEWVVRHRKALLAADTVTRQPATAQGAVIMDLQLNEAVVIVTGAAAGIGQATAGLLTSEGAVVVGVGRDEVEGSARRAARSAPT